LQQEHTIDTDNTDEANRYQRGVNFHQILRVTPAEAGHPRDSLAANAESSTINSLGAVQLKLTAACRTPLAVQAAWYSPKQLEQGFREALGPRQTIYPELKKGKEPLRTHVM
jgi:hypothetical protein